MQRSMSLKMGETSWITATRLTMKIDRINQHNIELDRMERANIQYKREEDYKKVIEKKNLEMIIAERVARNMRLDKDKGRYIDVEV